MAVKDLFYDLNYFTHHGQTKAKVLSLNDERGTSTSLSVEYYNDFTNRKHLIHDELPDWLIQKSSINEGVLLDIHYSKWKPEKVYFDLQSSPSPYIKLGLFLAFFLLDFPLSEHSLNTSEL